MSKPIVIEVVKPNTTVHYRATIEPRNPITTCTIETQTEPIVEKKIYWLNKANGFSFCRPGDIYDRETGCRMALTSALRKIDNASTREMFWKAYLEKFPVKERKSQDKLWHEALREVLKPLERFFDAQRLALHESENGKARISTEIPY